MTSKASNRSATLPPRPTRAHLDRIRTVLGVSRSQISRWRRDQVPDAQNADALAGLACLIEMLSAWLDPDVAVEWLHGDNLHLDGRTPRR